ncbi:MAG: sulfatase [Granulosicoccus sp.]
MPAIDRPNILICLFDSLSAADCGLPDSAGNLSALSHLCSSGAFFNRVYTPCPESSPARASFFTGLDPCVHGLWTNGVTLSDNEQTFAQRLTQAGYSNYLAGRYQLAGLSRWTTEKQRKDEFSLMDWAHGPLHRSRQNAYLNWLNDVAPDHYSQIFVVQANPDDTMATNHQREALMAMPESLSFNYWVAQRVGDWIDAQSNDKPFMAIAGFCIGDLMGAEPHPTTDGETTNAQALKEADLAIGRLLELSRNNKCSRDTVVIVTSARGSANSTSSDSALHEKAIRVPLVFFGADIEQQIVDQPVSTIDIAPTILDMAKLPIGPRLQEKSLLGVLTEEYPARGWAMSRIRKILPSGVHDWQTALCSGSIKLVVRHDEQQREKVELFDLSKDPLERQNLAGMELHAIQLEQMIDQMIDARCALEDRTEPRIAEF